jgi:hypothetical protein
MNFLPNLAKQVDVALDDAVDGPELTVFEPFTFSKRRWPIGTMELHNGSATRFEDVYVWGLMIFCEDHDSKAVGRDYRWHSCITKPKRLG